MLLLKTFRRKQLDGSSTKRMLRKELSDGAGNNYRMMKTAMFSVNKEVQYFTILAKLTPYLITDRMLLH